MTDIIPAATSLLISFVSCLLPQEGQKGVCADIAFPQNRQYAPKAVCVSSAGTERGVGFETGLGGIGVLPANCRSLQYGQ